VSYWELKEPAFEVWLISKTKRSLEKWFYFVIDPASHCAQVSAYGVGLSWGLEICKLTAKERFEKALKPLAG
jgi:hypothetical protein